MKKRVLGTKILAIEIANRETESGLIMPDTAESEKSRFKVGAIGEHVTKIEVGDIIYVPSKLGQNRPELVLDGKTYTILDEDNIIVVER